MQLNDSKYKVEKKSKIYVWNGKQMKTRKIIILITDLNPFKC